MATNAVLTGRITALGQYVQRPSVKDVSGNVILNQSRLDFVIKSGLYRISATAYGNTARQLHDEPVSQKRLRFYGSPGLRNHKLNMQVDTVE